MEALGAILLLLVSSYTVSAQSTIGISGLLNSPSAEMSPDGTVKIGGNILNRQLTPDYWNYHTVNYFLNITFLPFFEASLTNTALDMWQEGRFSNVDRSINFKLRPLKEGRYWPAVVVGSNDFITTSEELVTPVGGNRYFGKIYLALSKHFNINGHTIGLHTAYNYITSSSLETVFPVSGGISYSPSFYKKMNVIAEYDTKNLNVGANLIFLKYVYLQMLVQNLKYLSIGVHFQFTI